MNNHKIELKNNLSRKSVLAFSTHIFVAIFGLISMIFVKRYFGYELVGMLAFSLAYVQTFNIISDLGFGNAHQKKFNEVNLDKGICNGTLLTIKTFLSVLTLLLLFFSLYVYENFLNYEFDSPLLKMILIFTMIKVFLDNISMIFKNIYSAGLEKAKSTIPKISGRFIQMLLKLFVIFSGFTAIYIVYVEIFSSLFILIFLVLLFKKDELKAPNWNYIKSYSKYAFPVMFVGLISVLTYTLDKILLQYFEGSISVGVYTIPTRITSLITGVSSAIIGLLFPLFSKLYSQDDKEKIRNICLISVKYISITILPITVFLLAFAELFLISLFGNDSILSVLPFQILLIATYIISISTPYNIQILSAGFLRFSFYLNVFSLFANLSLNLYFIPETIFGFKGLGLGVTGACITTLSVFSIRAIICFFITNKITGSIFYLNLWKHCVAAILTFIILNGMGVIFSITVYHLPILLFISIFSFVLILAILKEFQKKELLLYISILNPKSMYNYISKEIKT